MTLHFPGKRSYMWLLSGILLVSLFTFSARSAEQEIPSGYVGPEFCGFCHGEEYDEWSESVHPRMLLPSDRAQALNYQSPPEGVPWSDVAYTIGGKWKLRYVNTTGYIITWHYEDGVKVPGENQWNVETERWANYHAGEAKKYSCSYCHTTGYDPTGTIEGMPGVVGSWAIPGITCEQCHGRLGHAEPVTREELEDPLLCGKCHIRTSGSNVLALREYERLDEVPEDLLKAITDIDAKGGQIRHHEQFEEWYNSPHREAGVTCQSCHEPHALEIKKQCGECHSVQAETFQGSTMYLLGVTCNNCHMAEAVKSAEGNPATYYGDVASHLWSINTTVDAELVDPTGKYANPYLPLGWACASPTCHGIMGWDTVKSADVVGAIQKEVQDKVNAVKSAITEAERAIDDARAREVPEDTLKISLELVNGSRATLELIESDGTLGVHNPSKTLADLEVALRLAEIARKLAEVATPPRSTATVLQYLRLRGLFSHRIQ